MSSLILVLLTMGIATATPRMHSPALPHRIHFEGGAICARVRGQIAKGQNEMIYVVGARAGQHMIVNLAPPGGGLEFANTGTVTAPSGARDGTKGGIVYDATLTETGDYKIRVARNLMATLGGRAGFVVEVIIY